ncbi:MAG: hypothetical protein AAF830_02310 [Pseudomonadota bacterium]
MLQTFRDACDADRRAGKALVVSRARFFLGTSLSIAKEQAMTGSQFTKTLSVVFSATFVLLTIPLIMTLRNPDAQLRGGPGGTLDNWDWTIVDFVAMGALLLAAGTGIALTLGLLRRPGARFGAAALVGLGFIGLWAEMATGVISRFVGGLA